MKAWITIHDGDRAAGIPNGCIALEGIDEGWQDMDTSDVFRNALGKCFSDLYDGERVTVCLEYDPREDEGEEGDKAENEKMEMIEGMLGIPKGSLVRESLNRD